MTRQKLITAAVQKAILNAPLYSTDGKKVVPVIVKFFTPDSNWTWYAVEGKALPNGDYEFFGLVDGHDKELGYFLLSDLMSVRGGLGLPVERDMYFDGYILDKGTLEVKRA